MKKIDRFTMLTARQIDSIIDLDIPSEYQIILIKYEMDKWRTNNDR